MGIIFEYSSTNIIFSRHRHSLLSGIGILYLRRSGSLTSQIPIMLLYFAIQTVCTAYLKKTLKIISILFISGIKNDILAL